MSRGTRTLFAAMTLTALGAAGGCGGGGDSAAPTAEEVAQGQTLFKQTCASCHGADAHGMPKLGKDLHGNQFVRSLDDQELLDFLKQGRPAFHPLNERKVDMPPKGGNPALDDEDLRLIGAYLRSIQ